jgi:ornithine cyclodeaminase/alanine dehydrogenase-like protein (mu-crystallin family)
MLILTAEEVRKALPMREAIEAVKRAYAALSDGRAEVPLRARLPIAPHDALSLFMPAYVHGTDGEALAVKVVSLFPGNPARGLAYIQAAVLVLEAETGKAAALLEGSSLTAIRTGAAGGAAVDLLSRAESSIAAIFGAGAQGRTQLEAACSVRQIETAWIYDADSSRANALAAELSGVGNVPKDLRVASNPRQAVAEADIICTATTSVTPVFSDADLKPGAHISAIGSYTPEMQEIPAETVGRARVVVDSRSASLAESGDLIQPIRLGLFGEQDIHAELGEIVLGLRPGRQSADEITLFKSVGIAVQDAVAAQLALANARKMGLGQEMRL